MTRHPITFQPAHPTRAERKALRRQIAEAVAEQKRARTSREDRSLPKPGVPGPFGPGLIQGEYWNVARLRVPFHEATSQHLAGIYPFVADAGLGHRGPLIGVDLNSDALWHFSPWDAYAEASDRGTLSTNILVLGAYRAGKSGTIKTLITRSLAFGHQAVIPADPKGEWAKVTEAVGGVVIRLGASHGTRLNPLDRGPRRTGATDEEHEQVVKQRRIAVLISLVETALNGVRLTAVEHAAIHHALEQTITESGDRPTLRGVYQQLGVLTGDEPRPDGAPVPSGRLVKAAVQPRFVLRRFVDGDLSGLFEDESTVSFDQDAPVVDVDTSELSARGDLVAQLTQICTTAWVQAVISDRAAHRQRYVVREEGWKDMRSLPALQMYQEWLKLSRHYGISNIVILHKLGDLDAVGEADSTERALAYSIIGDIENKFVFRVNHQEQTALQTRLNMPAFHTRMARQLRQGEFLAYVGQYAYLVDCFATSTSWEYDLFQTDDALIDPTPTGVLRLVEPDAIDDLWPTGDRTDDLDGWLASTKEQP